MVEGLGGWCIVWLVWLERRGADRRLVVLEDLAIDFGIWDDGDKATT